MYNKDYSVALCHQSIHFHSVLPNAASPSSTMCPDFPVAVTMSGKKLTVSRKRTMDSYLHCRVGDDSKACKESKD